LKPSSHVDRKVRDMEYKVLGRTGITVSRACLGSMMFGRWANSDQDECVRVIDEAFENGINFVDSADVYSAGDAEAIIGKAIKRNRDSWVICTKFGHPAGDDPNMSGASRRWIIRACEGSLRRLGTDYIDVYVQHRPDPNTDIEESLGALASLLEQGKVRAVGSSNFPAIDMYRAQVVAEQANVPKLRCEQLGYSMLVRNAERDRLPLADQLGMGVMCWSPLGGGWLTGKVRVGAEMPTPKDVGAFRPRSRYSRQGRFNQRKIEAAEAFVALAQELGIPITQLAIAFVLANRSVTSPILGPKNLDELRDLLAGFSLKLGQDVQHRIDEIVPPGSDAHPDDAVAGMSAYRPAVGSH
jgi:aryl-alcohol dehydrogenase-like predicted oxidoreductase